MKKKTIVAIAIVVIVALAGVIWAVKAKGGSNTVSDKATAVINAMMTCPNEDFYNDDMITRIGLGITMTDEEKKKTDEASKKAENNWEVALGKYFAEGYFKRFTMDVGMKYLNGAMVYGKAIAVQSIKLEQRTKEFEEVRVTVLAGEREQTLQMTIEYDTAGKMTNITAEDIVFD